VNQRLGIRIGFLIHDVSRLRRTLFDLRSPHLDITRSEAWVLTGISRRRSGISQTELAKVLGLGKVATGEFVAGLDRKGFVVRRLDDADHRAYCVQLTPRGRRILRKISEVVTQMNAELFESVSVDELFTFVDALRNMKLKLISMTETPRTQPRRQSLRSKAIGRVAASQLGLKPLVRRKPDLDL
jgi:MarR family transcriptional regulator, transcriptional regulator for hemolysin